MKAQILFSDANLFFQLAPLIRGAISGFRVT